MATPCPGEFESLPTSPVERNQRRGSAVAKRAWSGAGTAVSGVDVVRSADKATERRVGREHGLALITGLRTRGVEVAGEAIWQHSNRCVLTEVRATATAGLPSTAGATT